MEPKITKQINANVLTRASVFALCGMLIWLLAAQRVSSSADQGEVRTHKIVITNVEGDVIGMLGADASGQLGVWVYDKRKPYQVLSSTQVSASKFVVSNGNSKLAVLGTSTQLTAGLWFYREGREQQVVAQNKDNDATIWAQSFVVRNDGGTLATLGFGRNGRGGLWLHDPNGAQRYALAWPSLQSHEASSSARPAK